MHNTLETVTEKISSLELNESNTARAQSLRLEASSYRPFEQPIAEAVDAIVQVLNIHCIFCIFYN
jgi:hypothetical protein